MKAPDFWWTRGKSSLEDKFAIASFYLPSILYGMIASFRMRKRSTKVNRPVICLGNVIAGGAGKTPAALALCDILHDMGKTAFFLSRGYGGTLKGPVLVQPAIHRAQEVGDEALLLHQKAPTIIARDRVAGAHMAISEGADVIVMDDGFQNPSLYKNLSLIVSDSFSGIGNGLCHPAGPLRAPIKEQLRHADAILRIGDGTHANSLIRAAAHQALPIVQARMTTSFPDELQGKALCAFAGIGRPEKFFQSLEEHGGILRKVMPFPDHYIFSEQDAQEILDYCQHNHTVPITTAKDHVRLEGGVARARLASMAYILPITLCFEDHDSIRKMLTELF